MSNWEIHLGNLFWTSASQVYIPEGSEFRTNISDEWNRWILITWIPEIYIFPECSVHILLLYRHGFARRLNGEHTHLGESTPGRGSALITFLLCIEPNGSEIELFIRRSRFYFYCAYVSTRYLDLFALSASVDFVDGVYVSFRFLQCNQGIPIGVGKSLVALEYKLSTA